MTSQPTIAPGTPWRRPARPETRLTLGVTLAKGRADPSRMRADPAADMRLWQGFHGLPGAKPGGTA
jgi:hypothetical protein